MNIASMLENSQTVKNAVILCETGTAVGGKGEPVYHLRTAGTTLSPILP